MWLLTASLLAVGCSGIGGVPNRDTGGTETAVTGCETPEFPVELTGTWYDCVGTFNLTVDGAFHYAGLDDGCETVGTWTFDGLRIGLDVSNSTCPDSPTDRQSDFILQGMVMLAQGDSMIWVHSGLDNGHKSWVRGDGFSAWRWLLGGGGEEDQWQDLRLCRDPSGELVMGYYFTPEGKDGLISNSGRVDKLTVDADDPTRLQLRVSCQGGCLCAGILNLRQTDAQLDGTWAAVNCDGPSGSGAVTGTVSIWSNYL